MQCAYEFNVITVGYFTLLTRVTACGKKVSLWWMVLVNSAPCHHPEGSSLNSCEQRCFLTLDVYRSRIEGRLNIRADVFIEYVHCTLEINELFFSVYRLIKKHTPFNTFHSLIHLQPKHRIKVIFIYSKYTCKHFIRTAHADLFFNKL